MGLEVIAIYLICIHVSDLKYGWKLFTYSQPSSVVLVLKGKRRSNCVSYICIMFFP